MNPLQELYSDLFDLGFGTPEEHGLDPHADLQVNGADTVDVINAFWPHLKEAGKFVHYAQLLAVAARTIVDNACDNDEFTDPDSGEDYTDWKDLHDALVLLEAFPLLHHPQLHPFTVLLLYPVGSRSPESFCTSVEARDPEHAVELARAEAAAADWPEDLECHLVIAGAHRDIKP